MDDNITQVIFDYNKIFTALNSKLENNSLEQATEAERRYLPRKPFRKQSQFSL